MKFPRLKKLLWAEKWPISSSIPGAAKFRARESRIVMGEEVNPIQIQEAIVDESDSENQGLHNNITSANGRVLRSGLVIQSGELNFIIFIHNKAKLPLPVGIYVL
ncbi:hypothetical protein QAD02_002582 [Eretmocerus hayati]|uniref:Uncharacterized protein n=1 Tax=Eretmocerus hayati TaxID=131215 RepID=A0ACC2NK93_9HYME|nr:hypothetical protein QAD02_002582 [Eretmocerus hayati]